MIIKVLYKLLFYKEKRGDGIYYKKQNINLYTIDN